MKINEFIELLKGFNQDADITLTDSETITLSYVDNNGKYTKKDTPIVFIEPEDWCNKCASEYMEGDISWCSFYDKPCTEVEECYQFEEFNDP